MKNNKMLEYGIYIFVLVVPLMPFKIKISVIPVSVDFIIIAYLVLVLLVMLFNRIDRKTLFVNLKGFILSKLFIVVIIYSIICIISIYPAVNKSVALTELIRFWTYIFIFFIIINYIKEIDVLSNIVSIFTLSIFITCIIGIIQYFIGSSKFTILIGGYNVGRVFSTFINPNFWGGFINIVIFPIFMLSLKKVKHYKFLYVLSALLLLNLILTYTRGSWAGFGLGAILFVCLYNIKIIWPILVAFFAGLFVPGVYNRVFSTFDLKSLTISERFKLWKTGYLMFKDHPIIGVGNGNYLIRYKEYVERYPELYLERDQFSVHNSYLRVLPETGIMGILPFIAVIVVYVNYIIDVYKAPRDKFIKDISLAFLCSIVSYLFQNISNDLFFVPQVHAFYWVIGALIIAYNNIKLIKIEK